jgi:hypothetical protein
MRMGIEVLLQKMDFSLEYYQKGTFAFIIAETGLTYLDGMHLCKIVK